MDFYTLEGEMFEQNIILWSSLITGSPALLYRSHVCVFFCGRSCQNSSDSSLFNFSDL